MQPFKLTIINNPVLDSNSPGNKLTLTIDNVQNSRLALANIDFDISINTEEETNFGFELSVDQAHELIDALQKAVNKSFNDLSETYSVLFSFTNAKLSCAKGEIGKLKIIKTGNSERGAPGFGIYTLQYLDDLPDGESVIHQIDNFETFIPPDQSSQFEWLRALVGGNHQHTSSIKINLEGFSFEDIAKEFQETTSSTFDLYVK